MALTSQKAASANFCVYIKGVVGSDMVGMGVRFTGNGDEPPRVCPSWTCSAICEARQRGSIRKKGMPEYGLLSEPALLHP